MSRLQPWEQKQPGEHTHTHQPGQGRGMQTPAADGRRQKAARLRFAMVELCLLSAEALLEINEHHRRLSHAPEIKAN